MKRVVFAGLLFLATLTTSSSLSLTMAQQASAVHVTQIAPYDKAVPGQIMQLLVEGLEGGASQLMLASRDFKLTVSQDGVSQEARIRIVTPTYRSDPRPRGDANGAMVIGGQQMRAYQSVTFVVPHGPHTGPAELRLAYRGELGNSITLTIVEKPLRPVVGTMAVITLGPTAIPPGTRLQGNDLGWRLERGSVARLMINPLADPDDPNSAVLVRFKQGGTNYDATTRLKSEQARVENRNRGVGFFPARDIFEVDVPNALATGPVEVEIRLRANGQEGEAATLKATITDATRSSESPLTNAPRLLLVNPTRVGAGQTLMLSVDYRRTLDPDPVKTVIVVEQGTARYIVSSERNSLSFSRATEADAPVLFFIRPTKQIIGKAQVRVFNQLRGEQSGMSEPVAIEILEEPLAPDFGSVNESTEAELAALRQRYDLQTRAGRKFSEYDPQRKYATIHATGIDYSPQFVRITIEQNSSRYVLGPGDFSTYSSDSLIVRLPKELKRGKATITIENRGADSFSAPVSSTIEICCTH